MEHTGLFEKSNLVLKSQEFRSTFTLNFAQSDELPVVVEQPLKTVVVLGQVWIEARRWQPVVRKQPSPGCEMHSVLTKIEFPVVVCDFRSQTSEGIYGDANSMGPHSSFLEALDQNSAFVPCSEAKARFRFRIL